MLPVKENRPALYHALDALPWATTPIAHESTDTGHGRTTYRTIRVLPAPPGLPFPHVKQAWLIERYVTTNNGKQSAAAQLGIASHPAEVAGPAELAAFNRGHWAIETLHFIRDTCYREDNSRVRTRSGPRVLASLRNLAINALRLAGRTDITDANTSMRIGGGRVVERRRLPGATRGRLSKGWLNLALRGGKISPERKV